MRVWNSQRHISMTSPVSGAATGRPEIRIDTHTHILPESWPELKERWVHALWGGRGKLIVCVASCLPLFTSIRNLLPSPTQAAPSLLPHRVVATGRLLMCVCGAQFVAMECMGPRSALPDSRCPPTIGTHNKLVFQVQVQSRARAVD